MLDCLTAPFDRLRTYGRCRHGFLGRAGRNRFLHRLGRDHRAVAQRLLVLALGRADVGLGLDLDQHAADRDQVADLARQLGHRPRDGRFHFDRRLVGHHVGELLVFLDAVADLDVPGNDLGLGDAFANVGKLELIRRHYASTFLSAFFNRSGPGK